MRSSEQGSGGDASEGLASCWWRSIAEESPKGDGTSAQGRVVSELERLAAAGTDSLDELRHRLLSYKPGDLWFPTGGIPKEEMGVPPIITILLVGLAGAGKSSLVDLMYCVLGRAGLVHSTSPAGIPLDRIEDLTFPLRSASSSEKASIFNLVED